MEKHEYFLSFLTSLRYRTITSKLVLPVISASSGRLLKTMGWQEYPENDDNFLPITDAELQEFQAKTEKLKRNRLGQNGVLLKPLLKGAPLPLLSWRSPVEPELEEVSESESTSSSQTDDDADT